MTYMTEEFATKLNKKESLSEEIIVDDEIGMPIRSDIRKQVGLEGEELAEQLWDNILTEAKGKKMKLTLDENLKTLKEDNFIPGDDEMIDMINKHSKKEKRKAEKANSKGSAGYKDELVSTKDGKIAVSACKLTAEEAVKLANRLMAASKWKLTEGFKEPEEMAEEPREMYIVAPDGDGADQLLYIGYDKAAAYKEYKGDAKDWVNLGLGGGDTELCLYKYIGQNTKLFNKLATQFAAGKEITINYNIEDLGFNLADCKVLDSALTESSDIRAKLARAERKYGSKEEKELKEEMIPYKGYTIDYLPEIDYGPYSVQIEGDDLLFDTLEAAQMYIDEIANTDEDSTSFSGDEKVLDEDALEESGSRTAWRDVYKNLDIQKLDEVTNSIKSKMNDIR